MKVALLEYPKLKLFPIQSRANYFEPQIPSGFGVLSPRGCSPKQVKITHLPKPPTAADAGQWVRGTSVSIPTELWDVHGRGRATWALA